MNVTGGVAELTYPKPTSPEETGFYCLTDDVEILVHGTAESTSHTFGLDSNEWVTAPSNYMDVNHGNTIAGASNAQFALSDGTVYEDNLMRAPDGTWSVIPSGLQLVPAAEDVVYALSDDGVTTFRGARG